MTMHKLTSKIRRRAVLAGASLAIVLAAMPVLAQELSGELVILQWQGGTDAEMWQKLEADFTAKNPGVAVRELVVTGQGDMRGPMRTALLGGEKVDIIINTWPAFRAELVDAGILRPIDDLWASAGLDAVLDQSWKDLGSTAGVTYGVNYTYGDRSAIWYKKAHLEKAGVEPPKTWEEFLASIDKLKAAGFAAPIAMPAKYWAHGEWFETLLLRTGGVEAASKLAAHEIGWTDDIVKTTLKKYAELLKAGCCGTPEQMFAGDWDYSADQIFTADASNYLMIGMWMNARARNDYKLNEGVDYSIFQFPSLGLGHDDTSSVDAKEVAVTANGANPAAADAFAVYMVSKDAADILASYGYASPSKNAYPSLLGPVQQIATAAVAQSKVQFVLGDLLPGDLVDEYRVQLQKFLQDPSDATIDAVTAAIEAKAMELY
ncbi:ABC transporter substrate-binding protein [Devosia sp. Root413D1]|uniref:ABC transporter substrate-binding protein n=1 Tax=Devosia sp. Root413D1 TaxID=1736531 RepID=UPI0006F61379|nr:extracellular solute-binding protein [Devosia sp. Root413D1]KQW75645.1 ABC transporter substrate-binding protein [Devosia sp. Root413D1]